ncbi:MAG: TIGR01906 family membrane protein [Clostridiales Family XIII bacterium]|jgi:integral membrane protein (TIGR01906 family)|nr:TIGR01906 family membrane protein [Clostridiales Family XIII bacterium]
MKYDKLHLFTDILAAISIAIFVICVAVTATLFFRPLYYADIERLDIAERSGMEEAEIRENYDALIDYNSVLISSYLEFPTLPMSDSGREHFAEVRRIFVFFQYGIEIFGTLAACFIIIGRRIGRKRAQLVDSAPPKKGRLLLMSGATTLAVPVVLGAVALLGWEKLFVLFHEVVFDNDYWIFDDATDPVIKILPDEFFMHCLIMIVAIIVIAAVLLILAGAIRFHRYSSITGKITG